VVVVRFASSGVFSGTFQNLFVADRDYRFVNSTVFFRVADTTNAITLFVGMAAAADATILLANAWHAVAMGIDGVAPGYYQPSAASRRNLAGQETGLLRGERLGFFFTDGFNPVPPTELADVCVAVALVPTQGESFYQIHDISGA